MRQRRGGGKGRQGQRERMGPTTSVAAGRRIRWRVLEVTWAGGLGGYRNTLHLEAQNADVETLRRFLFCGLVSCLLHSAPQDSPFLYCILPFQVLMCVLLLLLLVLVPATPVL